MDAEAFWAVLRDRWNKAPLEVQASPVGVETAEADIWQAIVCAAAGGPAMGVSVTASLEGAETLETPDWLLPAASDGGLDEYLRRVDERAAGRWWSCAFSGLQRVSVPLWDRAAELASHVEDHLGVVPIGRTDVDVFIGRYKSTKAGIHQDFAHNLSFTLRGPKRLVTWSPDCAHLLPARSAEYEHLLDKAVVLNGKPGGVTYFPPDEFHIGESPDAATIALNVVFFEVTRDPLEEALMPVRSLLNPVAPIRGRGDGSTMNSAAVLSAFDQIEKMLADRSAHRISVARWLRSSTSARLDAARPHTSTTSALPSRMRLRSGARLLYTSDPSNSSMLLYSCDGNVDAAAQTPSIETLLNDLATGSIVEPPAEDKGTQVLGTLHEWGAVESA